MSSNTLRSARSNIRQNIAPQLRHVIVTRPPPHHHDTYALPHDQCLKRSRLQRECVCLVLHGRRGHGTLLTQAHRTSSSCWRGGGHRVVVVVAFFLMLVLWWWSSSSSTGEGRGRRDAPGRSGMPQRAPEGQGWPREAPGRLRDACGTGRRSRPGHHTIAFAMSGGQVTAKPLYL